MTITTAKIKTYLGITVTTYDTLLDSLATAVSAFMESYCNRIFDEATYTQEIYSGGKNIIFLKHYPVIIFTKLEYKSGSNSNPTWTEYTEDDYDLVDNRKLIKNSNFVSGINNIRATYSAGYATLPYEIEQLAIELIARKYNQRKSDGMNNESAEGASLDWNRTITKEQKMILNKYRKKTL